LTVRRIVTGYLAVAGVIAAGIALQHGKDSNDMSWNELVSIDVEAKPAGLWTLALDSIEGPALLKIEAAGQWSYSPAAKKCPPDGDLAAVFSTANCILPDAPVGALIAKIGGSTAGIKDGANGKLYVVGHMAVIPIDQNASGPVFLTINDQISGFGDNSGKLNAKLSLKRVPPMPAPAVTGAGGANPIPQPPGGTTTAPIAGK
jgi:hypothetical protein